MTDLQDEVVGENRVLSNRDKAEQSGDRGQDGKWFQTEQLEGHAANKARGQASKNTNPPTPARRQRNNQAGLMAVVLRARCLTGKGR